MSSDILLSICIPTYNRASYLKNSLSAIINQIEDVNSVEILVSDNCSTDNTLEVINEYCKSPKFKVIRQSKNVGPIRNGLDLVCKHSKGKYCWLLGDDDYLVNGGLKTVLNVLENNNKIDFLFVKIDQFEIDRLKIKLNETSEFVNSKPKIVNFKYEIFDKFESLLDPKYTNIFLGEIMASIFNRSLWLKHSDIIYQHADSEYLSSLETSYAHCVIFANQFMGKPAAYISTPIIIVDNRAREWSDKSNYLIIEQLLSLIKLYESKGLQGTLLKKCNFHYIKMTLPIAFKFIFYINSEYKNKISFTRYFKFLIFSHPCLTIKASVELFYNKMLKLKNK